MVQVIGHRGARNLAPENTLSSIQAAINLGLPYIEFDVTYSKDEVPFLVHEETISPNLETKCLELVERNITRRWAQRYSMQELKEFDAGSWFTSTEGKDNEQSADFSQEKLVTLEEVLNLDWQKSIPIIELKDSSYWNNTDQAKTKEGTKLVELVSACLGNFQLEAMVLSFNPYVLELCKSSLPNCKRVYAVWEDQIKQYEKVLDTTQRIGAEIVTIVDFMLLDDPDWIAKLKANNLEVSVYDLTPDLYEGFEAWNIEERVGVWKRLVDMGVDYITCDFPDELVKILSDDKK